MQRTTLNTKPWMEGIMSLASSLKSSTAATNPAYVPSCTFSPRGRNRFACNTCTKANGGGPIVLKRNQLEGHRVGVFLRNNPRSRRPPKIRYEPQPRLTRWGRSGVELDSGTPRPDLRTKYISAFAESWLCPDCFERNRFDKNYGRYGSAGIVACRDCGARFEIERGGA